MIKAVIFDLDETLILRSGAIRAFIKDQYRRFAPSLGGLDEELEALMRAPAHCPFWTVK